MNFSMKAAIDNRISNIQDITRLLWSVASLLAPWLVPLAPATFLGWAVYQTATTAEMPAQLAITAAIAAGVGLETVNIAANHAALHLSHSYEEHKEKFAFSIALVIAYVTTGIVAMVYLEISAGIRALGIAMFLLAPVAIAAQALTMDLARVADEVAADQAREDDDRQWQRRREVEREEAEREFGHLERMARIEANTTVRLERERLKGQPVNLPSTSRQLPDWLPVVPGSLDDFRRLVSEGSITLAGITGADLAEYIPAVGSDSTGRYWLRQVRNGNS